MVVRVAHVAVGGAVGALVRYLLLELVGSSATALLAGLTAAQLVLVAINSVGSAVIGWLWRVHGTGHRAWLLTAAGFCGGFTSFSKFAVDAALMIERSDLAATFWLLLATTVGCLTGVTAGSRLPAGTGTQT